ncbi:MAG: ribonuclease HI [Acidobacteria bacterium]|nr:ribonuclease HI [Acidobacteriota bacterium]
MPKFKCTVCDVEFDVPKPALDKYPGWEPKYCREHSPADKGAKKRVAGSGSRAKRRASRRTGTRPEENLTLAQVLAKYATGPDSGVFTDGSSSPNPGPGGWGWVWVENGEILGQGHGHESGTTTNNRMEFSALIDAYKTLPEDTRVTVHSDSRLCVNTITQWAPRWERNGWKRKGDPLKNLDLVKELLRLYRAHPKCKLVWIAAHSGDRWNEYADSLATAWMRDSV